MNTRGKSIAIAYGCFLICKVLIVCTSSASADEPETIASLKQENLRQAIALKEANAKIEKLTSEIDRLTQILDAVQNVLDKGKAIPEASLEVPCFNDLIELLMDIQDKKNQKASNFAKVHEKAGEIRKKYLDDLKNQADRDHPITQQLLWVIRDDLPRVLNGDLSTTTKQERDFAARLKEIEKLKLRREKNQ